MFIIIRKVSCLSVSLLVFLIISSCGNVDSFSTKKYNIKSGRISTIDEKPIYIPNGGEKKTNVFNKGRVERERINIQTKKLLDKITDTKPEPGIDAPVGGKIKKCYEQIDSLREELKTINPYTKDG